MGAHVQSLVFRACPRRQRIARYFRTFPGSRWTTSLSSSTRASPQSQSNLRTVSTMSGPPSRRPNLRPAAGAGRYVARNRARVSVQTYQHGPRRVAATRPSRTIRLTAERVTPSTSATWGRLRRQPSSCRCSGGDMCPILADLRAQVGDGESGGRPDHPRLARARWSCFGRGSRWSGRRPEGHRLGLPRR